MPVLAETPTNQRPSDAAATSGVPETSTDAANRRAHERLPAGAVAGLEGAKLASGANIKLIDLSRGGAQFETDRRFLPNSAVSIRLLTQDSTVVVHGRIVRSRIVRLDNGGLGYNVGVAFNELLQHVADERPAEVDDTAQVSTLPVDAGETIEGPEATTEPELDSDVTPEECAAFEASVPHAPAMLTVTASVNTSSGELLDMFNGNDW